MDEGIVTVEPIWKHLIKQCRLGSGADPLKKPTYLCPSAFICGFSVLGLYGLIQAYWLPWGMRGLHTVEILLDSLVYGWLLVRLLVVQIGENSGNDCNHRGTERQS